MGRARGRHHKLHYELQSVRDKSFENRLRHLVRHQFAVCEAESVVVVAACLDYLRAWRPDDREPLDVRVEIPAGRDLRFKVASDRVPCLEVTVSACVEHDLDLWSELGVQPMQTARAVRMIEQADRAGCTMPLSLVVSLVHQSTRTLSSRIAPLWKQGLRLPVLGIRASMQGSSCRVAHLLHAHLLTRPVGRPPRKPIVWYDTFMYQAESWTIPRRVVAKVEWHRGELFPRVGFIVTTLRRSDKGVVKFYNGRGIAEQWIKEGKNAVNWTRLSCHDFDDNQVRLQLFALAYNLGNFLRRLALPRSVEHWSMTTLLVKLIKIGAKVVSHARYTTFQMAEVAIPRHLFRTILRRIRRLAPATALG